MRLFKKEKKKADAKIVRDRRGKFWFTLYEDGTERKLASTLPPGYDSQEDAEAAVQYLLDMEETDEITFEDRFEG